CWFRPSGTGSGSRTGRMPVTPTRPTCCSACGATWDESRWHRHHAPPRGAAAATAHRRRPQPPPAEARRAPQQRSGPRRRVRGEAPVPAGRRPAAVGPPRLRARGPSLRARVRGDTGDGDSLASRRHAVHVGRETPEDRPREDGRLRPRLRRIGSWRRLHARPGRRGRRVVAAHARTGAPARTEGAAGRRRRRRRHRRLAAGLVRGRRTQATTRRALRRHRPDVRERRRPRTCMSRDRRRRARAARRRPSGGAVGGSRRRARGARGCRDRRVGLAAGEPSDPGGAGICPRDLGPGGRPHGHEPGGCLSRGQDRRDPGGGLPRAVQGRRPAGMTFAAPTWLLLAPLALLVLLALPRRRRVNVASTFLWRKVEGEDMRRSRWRPPDPLRLLQMALLVVVALLLAEPRIGASRSGSTVIVIDSSASMLATDVAPSRFHAALGRLNEMVRDWHGSAAPDASLHVVAASDAPMVVAVRAAGTASSPLAGCAFPLSGAAPDWPATLELALGTGGAEADLVVITDDLGAANVAPLLTEPTQAVRGRVHVVGGAVANRGLAQLEVVADGEAGFLITGEVLSFGQDGPVPEEQVE